MKSSRIGATGHRDARWARAWVIGWLGGPVLGIANGTIREAVYRDRLGELPAHQVSTATLIALLGLYMAALERRWPIPSRRTAWAIGGTWTVLTALFEVGLGRLVTGDSWSKILKQYDLPHGRVWVLVLVWMAVGPAAIRELRTQRSGH
jgi:hypothetical protein